MAVDTRNKRSSASNVMSPWRSMLPVPDSAITQPDRQHVAFMYSGIAADAPYVPPALPANWYTDEGFFEDYP